jgi:hypothetical protein
VAQGKLQEALDDYQQCLVISKRLAEQDKSNSGWQRDLIVSLYKVGPVRAKIKGSDNIKQAQGLLRTGLKTAELYPGGSMLARSYRDFSARIPRLSKPSYSGNPATGCTQ